jgi:hypothetical protein
MKALFQILVALCFFFDSSAQVNLNAPKDSVISVGEANGNKLYYRMAEGKKLFTLMYRDRAYTSIVELKAIQFFATDEEINAIHKTLKELFKSDKGTDKTMELGTATVKFSVDKVMGIKYLYAMINDEGVVGKMQLNGGSIDKLFGK